MKIYSNHHLPLIQMNKCMARRGNHGLNDEKSEGIKLATQNLNPESHPPDQQAYIKSP